VDQYIAAAEADGLEIVAVTETHIHADFVSGSRELAERTGARMYLSEAGPAEWQYGFRSDPKFVPVRGGERIKIGNVLIQPFHTPGHTPEHLSFFVTDGAAAVEPMGVLTGDFVFVGDVGRPDLLEKAAHVSGASDASARQLFQSLSHFKALPDHLQVWPGHGAGSACGKGIGAVPQSTIGYERRTNWAFGIAEEEAFVTQVLLGQPEPPRYFGIMKRINRDGPALLGRFPSPERVSERRLPELLAAAAVIVDTRPTAAFATGHIPGTINIPFNRNLATYAGSVLPYDRDFYLIVEGGPPAVDAVVRTLLSIGLDRVAGYLGHEVIGIWASSGQVLGTIRQVGATDLAQDRDATLIVDVRGEVEWRAGHIPSAMLVPLPELPERLGEIPADRSIVLHCGSGGRSSVAASLLLSAGRRNVSNLAGGIAAWMTAGLPVESG
jgi:hydroxyacylglutathione hydrolase